MRSLASSILFKATSIQTSSRVSGICPNMSFIFFNLAERTVWTLSSTESLYRMLKILTLGATWPIRCIRPFRCSNLVGFHGKSRLISVLSVWRLRPSLAASVPTRILISWLFTFAFMLSFESLW
ncbi:hypothetical protein DSECCO2_612010 [anaerobic digester metagenome]